MDSFELNKILGALLGTCILVLVTSFAAHAIFAPVMPEKPGFEIAVKEAAPAGETSRKEARPAPSRRTSSGSSIRSSSRARRARRA